MLDVCTAIMYNFFDKIHFWYKENHRDLPWRNTQNPYFIWVSEVILQQTRVAQGMKYFFSFLEKFPTIHELNASSDTEIMQIWQGLGYYSRALNMKKTAAEIVLHHNGIFPNHYDELIRLPGIGSYTAAAISSFAFDEPQVAIDGNVKRVAARYFGLNDAVDLPGTVKQIHDLLSKEMPANHAAAFNQATMELGALVCTPTSPSCSVCPLSDSCFANLNHLQSVLPVKKAKRKPVETHLHFLFLEHNGFTFIKQRNLESIWKRLYEFPNIELSEFEPQNPVSLFTDFLESTENITVHEQVELKHQLTHKTIFATFWHLSGLPSIIVLENYLRIPVDEVDNYPLHRLMQKYIETKENHN